MIDGAIVLVNVNGIGDRSLAGADAPFTIDFAGTEH